MAGPPTVPFFLDRLDRKGLTVTHSDSIPFAAAMTAATLVATSTQFRLHARAIRHSLSLPCSKGARLQAVLRPMLEDLNRLAKGCEQGARQLLALSPPLRQSDLLAFARSVSDQLASEQQELIEVLNLLRQISPASNATAEDIRPL